MVSSAIVVGCELVDAVVVAVAVVAAGDLPSVAADKMPPPLVWVVVVRWRVPLVNLPVGVNVGMAVIVVGKRSVCACCGVPAALPPLDAALPPLRRLKKF